MYFPGDVNGYQRYLMNSTLSSQGGSSGTWCNISFCTLLYVLSKTRTIFKDFFLSLNYSSNITLIVQVAPCADLAFANKVRSNKGLVSIIYNSPVQNIAYFGFDFNFGTPFILSVSVISTSSSITCNIYVNDTQSTTSITVTLQYSINMIFLTLSSNYSP